MYIADEVVDWDSEEAQVRYVCMYIYIYIYIYHVSLSCYISTYVRPDPDMSFFVRMIPRG